MKTRNIFLALLFLVPSIIIAQHEIKTDLRLTSFKTPMLHLSYEYISNKFGIEIDLHKNNLDMFVPDTIPSNWTSGTIYSGTRFDRSQFTTILSGKYYFMKHAKRFKRVYIGPMVGLTFLTKLDPLAIEKFQESRRIDVIPNQYIKGLNYYKWGFRFGWKFLIKSRIIIEPAFHFEADYEYNKVDWFGTGTPKRQVAGNWDIILKVGYRINKKRPVPASKDES